MRKFYISKEVYDALDTMQSWNIYACETPSQTNNYEVFISKDNEAEKLQVENNQLRECVDTLIGANGFCTLKQLEYINKIIKEIDEKGLSGYKDPQNEIDGALLKLAKKHNVTLFLIHDQHSLQGLVINVKAFETERKKLGWKLRGES